MPWTYDNWERLVEAVIRREQLRSFALADSRSPSIRSTDSDYSFSSTSQQDDLSFRTTPSPLHADQVKLKLALSVKEGKQSGRDKVLAKTRNDVWKGLSVFCGFCSKNDNSREVRELQWAEAQRILHGLEPQKTADCWSFKEISQMAEEAKIRAEIARLRELHALKGRVESFAKAIGVDLDSTYHYCNSSKKDSSREERESQWAKAQRTLHGLEPVKTADLCSKHNYEDLSLKAEAAKRKAEIARLRELHALKGRVESFAKAIGVDLDSIHQRHQKKDIGWKFRVKERT